MQPNPLNALSFCGSLHYLSSPWLYLPPSHHSRHFAAKFDGLNWNSNEEGTSSFAACNMYEGECRCDVHSLDIFTCQLERGRKGCPSECRSRPQNHRHRQSAAAEYSYDAELFRHFIHFPYWTRSALSARLNEIRGLKYWQLYTMGVPSL